MLVHNLLFYSVVFASPKMLFVEITICRATIKDRILLNKEALQL